MFKRIKLLIDAESYKEIKKASFLLIADGIFHGFNYGMLFFTLLNLVNGTLTSNKVLKYTIIMIAASLIRYFLLNKGYTKVQISGSKAIKNLRIRMGDYIRDINMGFFNKNNIGELTNIMTNDLRDFEQWITHMIPTSSKLLVLLIYLTITIIAIQPKLGLIQIGIIAVCLPLIGFCSDAIKKTGYMSKKVRARMLSRVIEYVKGMECFKSFNLVGESFKNLKNSLLDLKKESIRLELNAAKYVMPMTIIINISFPIVMAIGVNDFIRGSIDAENLMMFVIMSLALTNIMRGFIKIYAESRYFSLSCDKLLSIIETPQISHDLEKYNFKNYDIEFKNVDFEYIEGKQVLKNISFLAKENQRTALVGESGSGKSTVLNLITRFWDAGSGEITIGGLDVKKLYVDELLRHISMVFQDVYLLQDTIYENIRMGNENVSKEDVVNAAKLANCHDFIMKLPEGYDTVIQEGGESLSGGEKQRISIARAILKDAPIVLLDEATASLDADNEYEIQNAIKKITKDKTVLVIAHRLNTIKDSDQILVFEDGNIIEGGSHDELIVKGGKYSGMYKSMCEAKEWQI
ncbi:ABC transporter ATP-binding protein [Sporanaerobacter acetigenes]|uniref:ATP-binding cassette, subfamily B n=1 Tax=Sporanaerobacter acetigenes DSM 13106 TaxID=1123281 RepID=A0A1M5VRM8_9FIRM|nr:ABC transporter ATP-binding protein [Sporanaerobacter acetigenes]SHH77573.1 ATP-binding cassette, subfamily B [Sporanaerobacter acetigenes DSM 13106]